VNLRFAVMLGHWSHNDNEAIEGDTGDEEADMLSEGTGDEGVEKLVSLPIEVRRKTRDDEVARMR
jgi:hypothetical protein